MLATLMGLKSISPKALHQRIQDQSVTVMDFNSHQSWAAAHVPGAGNLQPSTFSSADLPTDRSALLVFYCANPMCSKAPRAARRAKKMGYSNVRVLSAGIAGWQLARLPTESGV